MKKIVGIIAAAALAASAFAEVNIGSWSRGVFIPFAYDGDTLRTMEGVSWSGTNYDGSGVRAGLGFSGSTENAGFVFDLHGNPSKTGQTCGQGDNGYVWAKPLDMLKIRFGAYDNGEGRLDECFGTWNTWRFKKGDVEITTGEGIGGVSRNKGTGACFTLTPIEGLIFEYSANFPGGAGNVHAHKAWWEKASFLAGYKANFGYIRAILNGQEAVANGDGDSVAWAKISVAADITAVENMTFKVGATVPTMLDNGNNPTDVQFAAGADLKFSPVTIHLLADMALAGKTKESDAKKAELKDFQMKIGAGVDFDINDALAAEADVRFANDKVVTDGAFGVYAGLKQNLSSASIKYGVELGKNVGPSAKADDFTFAVPLTIECSF